MRCMKRMNDLFSQNKKKGFISLALATAVFFSLSVNVASAAIVAKTPHARHLIHHYLLAHPALIEGIEQTQDDTLIEETQLRDMSRNDIAAKVKVIQPNHAVVPSIYPVTSSALSPGEVLSRKIQATLPAPMFIVGDDAMSKAWLKQYHKRLSQLHATGFVVNVSSEEVMHGLEAAFSHLSLMAIPANSIAKNLGIKHYPVLISDNRIEQ